MRNDESQRRSIPALYYTNRLLSQAGQGVFLAGLFLLAGQQSSTAMSLSSVFIAMMVAALVFALPGGSIVDALGGGRGLVAGAAGRAAIIGAAFFVGDSSIAVALVAFGYSAVSQVFSPSELALVSAIGRRHPPGAHATLIALQHGGQGIGILVLAPLAHLVGGPQAMVLTALTLYVAVVALSGSLSLLLGPVRATVRTAEAFSVRTTLRFYARSGPAANAGILLGFVEMATKTAVVALPIYIAQDLHLGSIEAMALAVPGGIGVLAGLAWAGRSLRLDMATQVMRLAMAGGSVGLIALAGLGSALAGAAGMVELAPFGFMDDPVRLRVVVAVPVALLLGLCFSVAPISARSVLSATAPAGQQARVFASQAMLTDLLSLTPLLFAGVGTELFGARFTFLAAGIAGVALFMLVEAVRNARGHEIVHPEQQQGRQAPVEST